MVFHQFKRWTLAFKPQKATSRYDKLILATGCRAATGQDWASEDGSSELWVEHDRT